LKQPKNSFLGMVKKGSLAFPFYLELLKQKHFSAADSCQQLLHRLFTAKHKNKIFC
jgi:hypothetical protein